MYLQQKGNGPAKEVLATGMIERVVSSEGNAVITVLVEALDSWSARMVRSTITIAFSPGEMALIAEAYDCGLDAVDEDDDNVEALRA